MKQVSKLTTQDARSKKQEAVPYGAFEAGEWR